jgi:alkylation response protein AidB-like acyl-CoA dehydrogenase
MRCAGGTCRWPPGASAWGPFALSEPQAGSDAAAITCRADRDGSGPDAEWVITGQKMWCTFADGANYLLLFARTGPPEPGRKARGISAFFVSKEPGDFPAGISGTPMRKIGYHGWKTWELSFDGFRIPGDALIGEEGRGFAIDAGERCSTEASMVKLFASEMSERVTSDALQMHGGAGCTKEFAVERHWRDARLTKIFEGASEIQQRIISDDILGRL